MWPRENYESLVLDRSDRALLAVDRRILRSLARGYPGRWTPPEDSDLGDGLEGRFLLDLYRTIFLANKGSRSPQIRARAAQSQCQLLLSDYLVRKYWHEFCPTGLLARSPARRTPFAVTVRWKKPGIHAPLKPSVFLAPIKVIT